MIAGLWIDECGKVANIADLGDGRFAVTVHPGLTESPFGPGSAVGAGDPTVDLPAVWKETSPFERLPGLQVEAEAPSGRLWYLHLAVRNDDPNAHDGFLWRKPDPDEPRELWRLIPGTGAGFIDAVCYMEDEAEIPWAEPRSPFRPATREEGRVYSQRWSVR